MGATPTEVTLDFGRVVLEKQGEKMVNVGVGQVVIILTFQTSQALRDILDSLLKTRTPDHQ